MRLVYLSESILPSRLANSVHVMKMCSALAGQGHDLCLVGVKGDDAELKGKSLFGHYGVQENFRVKRIPYPRIKGGSLIFPWLAARAAKACKPEMAYGRYARGMALLASSGIPLVFETHQPVAVMDSISRRAFRRMEQKGNLKRLVVISQALKDLLAPETTLQDILVAHDAVDLHHPPLESPEGFESGKYKVGYFGSLYEGRGVEVVVELARRFAELDFHLVGGRESDLAKHKSGGLPRNLVFHGFVPPAAVPGLMASCQALLMPYQRRVTILGEGDTSRWMSPLKMFEYLASGVPLISSDIPVLREVLTPGVNALLAPPDDLDAWQSALEKLLAEPEYAAAMARRGREDVAEKYTWAKRAELVLEGI